MFKNIMVRVRINLFRPNLFYKYKKATIKYINTTQQNNRYFENLILLYILAEQAGVWGHMLAELNDIGGHHFIS